MIRVIIADDEIRICKLIINLINWDELGMEIVGAADNGIDALSMIEKENPDIVITDIRMPGYDGLEMIEKAKNINEEIEFIIISGYEEFAYAQKAIEYGVKDYLCKPINKESLLKALCRVNDSLKIKNRQSSLEKEYQIIKKDIWKIRASFLKNLILFNADGLKEYSQKEINQNHYFHFREGNFRVISIKIDSSGKANQNIDKIITKMAGTIQRSLLEQTYDAEIIHSNSNLYVLINYRPDEKEKIESVFIKILNEFKSRLATFGLMITIGYGEDVEDLKEIATSIESAKGAIDDRILKGTGRIIEFSGTKSGEIYNEDRYYEFTKKFMKAVELVDPKEIKKVINTLKEELSRQSISGSELKRLAREMGNTYYIIMRKNKIRINDALEEQAQLENTIDNCYSMELLFQELADHITLSLSKLSEDKNQKNLGQIRQAKIYIEENYMKNITLEDLGSYLGFNPSYFSSLFKKETGTSFIEYLSKIRMEKAKELLKEPGLRIQDICLMVGYNDVKYFTKLFIKHTGLKPNEFRKIFA
jgi:two-component system response regulator YesN